MLFLDTWRRRRLERELEAAISAKEREDRIHRRNVSELEQRIQRIERDLAQSSQGDSRTSEFSATPVWALD